ncbi:MAG: histidinol-phosphate transaminase [Pyrinomonadaceae bacterium]
MFELDKLIRPNIRDLKPYSSARHEFIGSAEVYLDANENAFGSPIAGAPLNRYPDPLQSQLKQRLAEIKRVAPNRMFVGNGSDEAIDLLFRIFCEPGRDACIVCPPTYGMYTVSAAVNDVEIVEVPLVAETFELDMAAVKRAFTARTKLLFICSPNNPTGNAMRREAILDLAASFGGIVVVDEAYIDYSSQPSLVTEIDAHPNLVVLQTFSKAWGMAGARVGLAFASERIVDLLNRVKPPYNVSQLSQTAVLDAMKDQEQVREWIDETLRERDHLVVALPQLPVVEKVYPSDANFLLVKVSDANAIYDHLVAQRIVVRNRSTVLLCGNCLRITVGTPNENTRVLAALESFGQTATSKLANS